MPNAFLNLPVPAANGAGAAVDVSVMGATKTIIVGGVFEGAVGIEYATDAAPAAWAPLPEAVFNSNPGRVTIDLAARWMRATMTGYKSGAANADVGAPNTGAEFIDFVVPAVGDSAPVDISGMPTLKTVVVGGPFTGSINLQVSEDGVDYSTVMSFQQPGGQTAKVVGQFARVRHSNGSGSPVMAMAAAEVGSGDIGLVTNFVFRPGGVAINNVYTDWNELYADLQKVEGYRYIQFDSQFAPCVIPGGTWDMSYVEWHAAVLPGTGIFSSVSFGDGIDPANDAIFPNLQKVGGELSITCLNVASAPIAVNPAGQIFELGTAESGDFPIINNNGLVPFFDHTNANAGADFNLRMWGRLLGSFPGIDLGNTTGRVTATTYDSAALGANMVIGTNAGARLNWSAQGSSPLFARQQNFAGTIRYTPGGGGASAFLPTFRTAMAPASTNQGIITPSTTPSTANINRTFQHDPTAGDILQPLAEIRMGPDVATGDIGQPTDTSGQFVIQKNRALANNVVSWPNSPIAGQAAAVDTAGGGFVLAGTTITFTPTTAGLFTSAMVGKAITIAGATTPGNDGSFLVTSVPDANTVTYENAAGATEALVGPGGTWRLGDTVDGLAAPVTTGPGLASLLQSDGISNWVQII